MSDFAPLFAFEPPGPHRVALRLVLVGCSRCRDSFDDDKPGAMERHIEQAVEAAGIDVDELSMRQMVEWNVFDCACGGTIVRLDAGSGYIAREPGDPLIDARGEIPAGWVEELPGTFNLDGLETARPRSTQ